ncbi:MAG: hypothetical protein LBS83_03550, partial [Holosporales bacterium]|nr:hypothetical protein [Holosporales bacterium]
MSKIVLAESVYTELLEGERISLHFNKKNGETYVYAARSERDLITKLPLSKQRYLGKLNKSTNELIKTEWQKCKKTHKNDLNNFNDSNYNIKYEESHFNKNLELSRITTTKIVGPYLILDKICNEIGLLDAVKTIFPEFYKEILSIVYYIVHKVRPLYLIDNWSNTNLHPFGEIISSQRVSEILRAIS